MYPLMAGVSESMETKALKRECPRLYLFTNFRNLSKENSDTVRVLLTLDFVTRHNAAFLMKVHITH